VKYSKYPSYRDSGVEWLGEIPEHWKAFPARSIVSNLMDKNETAKDQRYLSLMANIGVIKYEDKGDVGNKKPDDLSKCKIVKKGNLVINSMNYSIGSYGMSSYDGVCSPVYVVLDINKDKLHPAFGLRLFENKAYQRYVASFGNGILAHRSAIGWDEIKGSYMPLPPLQEQQTIANYLDIATAKIDILIEKQTKLIELLREKRQAVISTAVTRGLDSTVAMKDSGVEWLGEIPEGWMMSKLKYDSYIKARIGWHGMTSDELFEHGDAYAVTGSDFLGNNVNWKDCRKCTLERYEQDKFIQLKDDDLLVTKDGTIGKIIKVNKLPSIATLNGGIFVIRPLQSRYDTNYYYWLLISTVFKGFVSYYKTGSTISHLYQDTFCQMPYSLPSIEEQRTIATYLENKTSKIDTLVTKATKAIDLLKEKRTALISSAVTGKIDVREINMESA